MKNASYTPDFIGFSQGDEDEGILDNPIIREAQQKILALRKHRCETSYLSAREKVKSFCTRIDTERKRRQLQELQYATVALEQVRLPLPEIRGTSLF